jgi:serine/threonine-protein kinase HipA
MSADCEPISLCRSEFATADRIPAVSDRSVDVHARIGGRDVPAGRLYSHRRRGAESATFTYDEGWLASPQSYELDPQLPLSTGAFQTPAGRALFGAFADSAPDRWGRRLIRRRERRRAQQEGAAPSSLGEIDFLLGVRDDARQGALRFRAPGEHEYLAAGPGGVPHVVDLERLLNASLAFEEDRDDDETLALLLRAGSSLGGARPKAHVTGRDDRLAIAKFPSSGDAEWNITAWERVALILAERAGVDVPRSELVSVAGRDVLIVERFDRHGAERLGYASAMTMLEASDGDQRSYLEIAEVIERTSPATTRDLHQLWRRVAFSVLISNTDDHLRNHGFLHTGAAGWGLAPAFDLNPDPDPGPKFLSTAIDLDDPSAIIENVLAVAAYFRLNDTEARTQIGEIVAATSTWRGVAGELGIPARQITAMEPAFEHDQRTVATGLQRR